MTKPSRSLQKEDVAPLVLLFLIFLVLKLAHVISWSWWWVTCPLWIAPAIGVCVALIVLVGVFALFVAAGHSK